MSRTSQIQQLYVGLLGRAADAEGLQYWNGTGLSIAEIANWIVESAEEFPRTDRDDAVVALYANLFNREPDAEGRNYWVNESDVSIDELVLHLIEWADPTDATALANRTFVADAYTRANVGAELDLEAAAAVIAGVDHTTQSVTEALETIEGGAGVGLEQGLAEYQSAVAARAELLESAKDNAFVKAALAGDEDFEHALDPAYFADLKAVDPRNPTEAEIEAAIEGNTINAATGLFVAVNIGVANAVTAAVDNTDLTITDFNSTPLDLNGSQRAIEAALADAQEDMASALAELRDEVNEISGLNSRINTLATRFAQEEAASAALEEADTALDREVGAFDGENGVSLDLTTEGVATVSGKEVATFNEERDRWEAGADASDYAGVTSLVSALQAQYKAEQAADTALERLATAASRVIETETEGDKDGDFFDADGVLESTVDLAAINSALGTDAPLSTALLQAGQAQTELNAALADFAVAAGLASELEARTDAIADAAEALEDSGFAVVELDGDDYAGTEDDDLFLFADQKGEAYVIDLFGEQGVDRIFVGEGYTLFDLAGKEITERVGSATELEIFWEQDGEDVILYVESEVAAGTDLNTDQLTQITLTGVSADDIVYEGGFLALA